MNDALDRLARELVLDTPARDGLRLRFGLACVQRVRHLLEDAAVVACLDTLGRFVDGRATPAELEAAAAEAAQLANHHPGSRSLDGVGHAAVSASYAVANALAGKALRAAEYAAYATVYGEGGYGAVQQRESFQPEFDWQLQRLRDLAAEVPR
ncbi:hypothetical protein J2X20_003450 [Pelomonas saccharophila]|uniref:Uncharacterized protein n=1 Tax=Roseateles saccharophilus TaxID=304 RepID=A0ABU1YPK5_ROSSA|nr:hypothetical protein [Roseateles saccharophilus]MDR7270792.1 hypothetical protein [Roseateles saccharophilus]